MDFTTSRLIRYMALENNAMIPLPIVIRRVMQTELDMTDMNLGDDFVLLLAGVMHELPHVEHLNLTGNKLTDEGLKDILGVGVALGHVRVRVSCVMGLNVRVCLCMRCV